MTRSIAGSANKPRRTVDYFTDNDEGRVLEHPDHQGNHPAGVQKIFVYHYVCIPD